MLVISEANIVILAVPKTGSTALEGALRHQADIVFGRGRKHITAQRYRNRVAPFLERTFGERLETVAVMREPLEQLRSWFCYRSQPRHAHTSKSTQEMTFNEFIRAVLKDSPPKHARVGSQFRFLTDAHGGLLVTHLFSYGHQPKLLEFLSHRIGEDVALARENVSPIRDTDLSARIEKKLRTQRASDFALYNRLMAANGYLGPGWARSMDVFDMGRSAGGARQLKTASVNSSELANTFGSSTLWDTSVGPNGPLNNAR